MITVSWIAQLCYLTIKSIVNIIVLLRNNVNSDKFGILFILYCINMHAKCTIAIIVSIVRYPSSHQLVLFYCSPNDKKNCQYSSVPLLARIVLLLVYHCEYSLNCYANDNYAIFSTISIVMLVRHPNSLSLPLFQINRWNYQTQDSCVSQL